MKNQIIFLLLAFLILFFTSKSSAQSDKFSTLTTIGVTTPILDNGIGIQLGVNPSYALFPHFSVESQLSYTYTKINGSFISGKELASHSLNALVGGRLYLNSEAKTTRFYINALIGANYNKEAFKGIEYGSEFSQGFSGGGFVELNQLLIGLAFETPQNILLKVGYGF